MYSLVPCEGGRTRKSRATKRSSWPGPTKSGSRLRTLRWSDQALRPVAMACSCPCHPRLDLQF